MANGFSSLGGGVSRFSAPASPACRPPLGGHTRRSGPAAPQVLSLMAAAPPAQLYRGEAERSICNTGSQTRHGKSMRPRAPRGLDGARTESHRASTAQEQRHAPRLARAATANPRAHGSRQREHVARGRSRSQPPKMSSTAKKTMFKLPRLKTKEELLKVRGHAVCLRCEGRPAEGAAARSTVPALRNQTTAAPAVLPGAVQQAARR
jgi:hypothetical protein